MGAYQAVTIEKSSVSFVLPETKPDKPRLDDGGSGGDIGKNIFNGGGGGDGDDGDDDDYFEDGDGGDGDGGEGGDGFFRVAIPELYDKVSLGAVFQEWMKTLVDLPIIIRQAVEMGLVSSAQLYRFLSMDVRPNITRAVSRTMPPTAAREFVGRLMADPGFVHKLVGETTLAAGSSLYYEWWIRREKFQKEIDLALINTIGVAAATAATVWMVAPSRSYGSVHKLPWQRMLDGLPNMVFDSSGPMRQYSNQARVGGFFAKMAELSAVGMIAGGATSLLSQAAVAVHKRVDPSFEPSVPVPQVGRSSAGMGAYFALNANTRYQLIGGMDKYLFERANSLWAYVGMTALYRVISNRVGEASRPWWQGLPTEPTKRKVRKTRVRSSGPYVQRQQYDDFLRSARGETGAAVQYA